MKFHPYRLQKGKSLLFHVCFHGEDSILGFMQCYPLLQFPIYHLDRYPGSQKLKILPSRCY